MERVDIRAERTGVRVNTKKLGYIAIELTFVAAIATAAYFWEKISAMTPINLLVLALATFRTARTISFNEVAEWIREPFCKVVADGCGAGADVHPKAEDGFLYTIGSLISCPICTGTWAALALFLLWTLFPAVGIPLAYILAIAGASELIHYIALRFEWGARESRVTAGKISPDKRVKK